ncbi:MAG: SUMF1/EgtB/PvdO family nonheme iron enzyme [Phycisphaerales bacterium]
MTRSAQTVLISTLAVALCSPHALGQLDIDDPERWALVTARDNIPFEGGQWGKLEGRGSVPYAYRISRLEITTDDWLEFANTFSTMSDELDELLVGQMSWGARPDFSHQGPGGRYILDPDLDFPGLAPIRISWHQAAMYCNWLHNGKTSDPATIHTGAYDTSTFGRDGPHWTDQSTRSCGARFWIPSLDEYLKAAHFDPDKSGQGPGWWAYGHSADDPPVQGLPGVGHTIMGLDSDDIGTSPGSFPLGAFDQATSPWGVFDLIGGSPEWTEEWTTSFGFHLSRMLKDSSNNFSFDPERHDHILEFNSLTPSVGSASVHICAIASTSRVDLDLDGRLTFFDVLQFISRYIAGSLSVDLDCDGSLSPSDIGRFIDLYHE